ncbi:MCP four helix bundle domain-containing protein [Shewanella sp. 202IG2-18]|uniref:HAMP domain-containing methyl-accepting chemotaxis protein n=1 Tax=Parashewanella hymeniacidonis TaxID=2807618 RepID=UPI00195FBFA9|nr:methyl-accepting chemotaxis protein [Parashewanella hymeniacidonis]MBM7074340.1 MCP four helix bundle domain-containing protein [Parashewanella hymeniacidonis]
MKLSIGNKLGLGFSAIVLFLIINAVISHFQIKKMQELEHQLVDLRFPTKVSGWKLLNGVNDSLASLRGYMILGKDPEVGEEMKLNRQQSLNDIDSAIKDISLFSTRWESSEDKSKFIQIKSLINEFKDSQTQIEMIAHDKNNIPSYSLLIDEAMPLAELKIASLTELLDIEEGLSATPERKMLLKSVADLRDSFELSLAGIRSYLLSGDNKYEAKFNKEWKHHENLYQHVLAQQALFSPSQQQHWSSYKKNKSVFSPLPTKILDLRSADDWNKANYLLASEAAPRVAKIKSLLADIKESQEKLVKNDLIRVKDVEVTTFWAQLISTLIAIAVSALIATLISKKISSGLNQILQRTQAVADGDLSGKPLSVNSNDELGELTCVVNKMSSSLNELISEVNGAMYQVSEGSEQLTEANNRIAKNMEEQSQQADMVSAAIEEMSASIRDVAQSSMGAADGAVQTEEVATRGQSVVDKTISSMQKIDGVVVDVTSSVKELGNRGEEIGSIVTVISSIADQTNLLALNAAIEAARAGEYGRGFSVVADEVRQLAQRTVVATEEIKSTISAMQKQTEQVIHQMDSSIEQVQQGVELAEEAGGALNEIVTNAQNVAENIQSIATVGEEQSAVSGEVAENMDAIARVTGQSLATTTEAAVETRQLSNKVDSLSQLVAKFKLSA